MKRVHWSGHALNGGIYSALNVRVPSRHSALLVDLDPKRAVHRWKYPTTVLYVATQLNWYAGPWTENSSIRQGRAHPDLKNRPIQIK